MVFFTLKLAFLTSPHTASPARANQARKKRMRTAEDCNDDDDQDAMATSTFPTPEKSLQAPRPGTHLSADEYVRSPLPCYNIYRTHAPWPAHGRPPHSLFDVLPDAAVHHDHRDQRSDRSPRRHASQQAPRRRRRGRRRRDRRARGPSSSLPSRARTSHPASARSAHQPAGNGTHPLYRVLGLCTSGLPRRIDAQLARGFAQHDRELRRRADTGERGHACERAGQRGLVPRELAVADASEPDARRAGVAFDEAYSRACGRRKRRVGDAARLDAAAVRASCRCRRCSTSRSGRLCRHPGWTNTVPVSSSRHSVRARAARPLATPMVHECRRAQRVRARAPPGPRGGSCTPNLAHEAGGSCVAVPGPGPQCGPGGRRAPRATASGCEPGTAQLDGGACAAQLTTERASRSSRPPTRTRSSRGPTSSSSALAACGRRRGPRHHGLCSTITLTVGGLRGGRIGSVNAGETAKALFMVASQAGLLRATLP
jgi:hypothetical protein